MREHKYRGKTSDGEWKVGDLTHNARGQSFINIGMCEGYDVIPETVSEYTGLNDKNGAEIYENCACKRNGNSRDLVKICFGEFGVIYVETERVIDEAVGWYMKVIETDVLSTVAPFNVDLPLNKYWINRLKVEIVDAEVTP